MSGRDLLDDYMDYKLSDGEDDEKSTASGESSGCLPWIIGALLVIWIISKLFS